MFNQTCGRVLRGDVEELSSTLFELLRSHVEMVFAAIAQFEDWRMFCENVVDLDRDSISALSQSTIALARSLKTRSDTTREVSEALDTVVGWAKTNEADKRDVLALTSTLQNFWSLIAKSALAKEVANEGRKFVAKAIIGIVAATTAGTLAAFGKVPGVDRDDRFVLQVFRRRAAVQQSETRTLITVLRHGLTTLVQWMIRSNGRKPAGW